MVLVNKKQICLTKDTKVLMESKRRLVLTPNAYLILSILFNSRFSQSNQHMSWLLTKMKNLNIPCVCIYRHPSLVPNNLTCSNRLINEICNGKNSSNMVPSNRDGLFLDRKSTRLNS